MNLVINKNFKIENKENKINKRYLCDSEKHKGQNKIPNIKWNKMKDADFYSLIMEDPDAPNKTFTHLYIPVIPNTYTFLDEQNLKNQDIIIGYNSNNERDYLGPCNPFSKIHHYYFIIYAVKATDKSIKNMKNIINQKDMIETKNSKEFESFLKNNKFKILSKEESIFKYKL